MPVKSCLLQGRTIHSLDDLYSQLMSQLPFPAHFGCNLDALWDVLSTDLEGPVEVIWEDMASSRSALGGDFDRVVKLLKDVAEERDDFNLILR